jgi:hypothetical protein
MAESKDFALQLTIKELKCIPQHEIRNDFTFIVGDSRYSCPWYVADFLSPTICHLHEVDPLLDEF